jgi:hypothetical protein
METEGSVHHKNHGRLFIFGSRLKFHGTWIKVRKVENLLSVLKCAPRHRFSPCYVLPGQSRFNLQRFVSSGSGAEQDQR